MAGINFDISAKPEAQEVYSFYRQRGWRPHQAAALAGNAFAESNFNPNVSHDQGTGYGIFGFRDPKPGMGRRTDLFTFAKERGLDPKDRWTQLEFSDYELRQGKERGAGAALAKASDLTGAQNAVMGYLRPQGYTAQNPQAGHRYGVRLSASQSLLGADRGAYSGAGGQDSPRENAAMASQGGGYSGQGGQDSPREMAAMAGAADAGSTPVADMMAKKRAEEAKTAGLAKMAAGLLSAAQPKETGTRYLWDMQMRSGLLG
jgi:hypothetical protein